MTTTKRSTFGAGLRTTILLATLSGLLVAIGDWHAPMWASVVALIVSGCLSIAGFWMARQIRRYL